MVVLTEPSKSWRGIGAIGRGEQETSSITEVSMKQWEDPLSSKAVIGTFEIHRGTNNESENEEIDTLKQTTLGTQLETA